MKKIIISMIVTCLTATAAAQTYTEVTTGHWGYGRDECKPALIDLDNDGLLDLIVGHDKGSLYHYEQNSVGSTDFSHLSDSFDDINVMDSSAPTFVDLDNNGLIDLIIGIYGGRLYHYEQNSAGSTDFTLVTNKFNDIDVGSSSMPCFTDLNNDGLLDLIIGDQSGNIEHYQQNGIDSTTFSLVTDNFMGINVGFGAAPCFVDLDQNGKLDMIIGSTDGKLYHYEQSKADTTDFTLITNNFIQNPLGHVTAPCFIDLNSDGLLDLIIGNIEGQLNYYEQEKTGSRTFNFVRTLPFQNYDVGWSSSPAITDLNQNGKLDMLVGNNEGRLTWYEESGIGSENFILRSDFFNKIDAGSFSTPFFTDCNEDGLWELMIGEHDGNINHYQQDALGDTNFTPITEKFNNIDVGEESAPCFTDLDGDGLLDFLVGTGEGDLHFYEQDAVGSVDFSLVTDSLSGIDVGYSSHPAVTDLDDDGLLDLLIGEFWGNIEHYEQDGVGSIVFNLVTETFAGIDIGLFSKPGFADLNRDGLDDLIIGEDYGGILYFRRNKDTGLEKRPITRLRTFQIFQNFPNPFNPSTTIRFNLLKSSFVTLKMFNLLGEEIETLISGNLPTGEHTIKYTAEDLPSGIYLYTLQAGAFTESKKMILLR